MSKIDKWEAQHVNLSGIIHVFIGLGIAWLLSLAWQGYSVVSLVLGIVFLLAGIVGLIYAQFAKQ